LVELYADAFDGETAAFPAEDRLEDEVNSLSKEVSQIEKEMPAREQSVIHLQQARNALNIVVIALQSLFDGPQPLSSPPLSDDGSVDGSDYTDSRSLSSTPISSSSSLTASRRRLSFRAGVHAVNGENINVTYAQFQEFLPYIADAQSHLQQAAALTPKLPDIFEINLIDIMPFKDPDFATNGAEAVEARGDAKIPYAKVLDALEVFRKHLNTVVPALVQKAKEDVQAAQAQLESTRSEYETKKISLVTERKRILDSMLEYMEELPLAKIPVSPSSSRAVVVEEAGRQILLSDNTALVPP